MPDDVRFLHAADLHFGAPLESPVLASSDRREWLNRARERALERIVDLARRHEVEFVLWSGDLYDRRWRSVDGVRRVSRQLERLLAANVDVLVARGNMDPAGVEGNEIALPEGVTAFPVGSFGEIPVIRNGDTRARVYGRSRAADESSSPSLDEVSPPDASAVNIGLVHLPGREAFPGSLPDASDPAMDYWALGLGHEPRFVEGSPALGVAGTPQGVGPEEPGLRGCLLVTARAGEGVVSHRFCPVGDTVWWHETLDLDAMTDPPQNPEELRDRMVERARKRRERPLEELADELRTRGLQLDEDPDPIAGHVVRWTVRGRGDLHPVLEDEKRLDRFLTRELNRRFGDEEPFLLTDSVYLRTGRPLPAPLEELAGEDEVIGVLQELLKRTGEEEAVRNELRTACGEVWDAISQAESLPPGRLALTRPHFRELLDHAATLVVDRVLEERSHDVD